MASIAAESTISPAFKRRRTTLANVLDNAVDAMYSDGLREINKLLSEVPEKILPALSIIRGDSLLKMHQAAVVDDKPFPSTYCVFARIPKEVCNELAALHAPSTFPTADSLKSADKAQKNDSHHILWLGWGLNGGTKWPRAMHDKTIFHWVMTTMYHLAGRRLSGIIFERNFKSQPVIAWHKCGVFKLLPPGSGRKTQIYHIDGDVVDLPPQLVIMEGECSLDANWAEFETKLRAGRFSQCVADLFPAETISKWKTTTATAELSRIATAAQLFLSQHPDCTKDEAVALDPVVAACSGCR